MYQQKYIKYKNKYLNLINKKNDINKNQTYLIQDNGGRPFKVVIDDNNKVMIYKQDNLNEPNKSNKSNKFNKLNESDEDIYDIKPFLTLKPINVFIGKSPLNKWTEFSGGYGPKFDGNTILLDMGSNKYICIKSNIFSFDADNKIIEYVSIVGNNDVPYPYAVDENGDIYLLVDDVIIENNSKTKNQMQNYDNPYEYYYDYNLITSDRGVIPKSEPKIKNFNGIKKYLIGTNNYTLRYEPLPEKNYDDVIKRFKNKPMYIIDINNKKIKLSKDKYIELMETYGATQSFRPIRNIKEIKNRDIGSTFLGFYLQAVNQS